MLDEPRIFSFVDKDLECMRTNVLLKSTSCINAGKCVFCTYWQDTNLNHSYCHKINMCTIKKIPKDVFGILGLAPSASIFEVPFESLFFLKEYLKFCSFDKIQTETHWYYRNLIQNFKSFIALPCDLKIGIETFDNNIRKSMGKDFEISSYKEVLKYSGAVNMIVGLNQQTIQSVEEDIKICGENFEYSDYNLLDLNYVSPNKKHLINENLVRWFIDEGQFIAKNYDNIKVWLTSDEYLSV